MKLNVSEIPPDIGHYLAGFTDGEGSFNVSFRPRSDYKLPWKVSLCFNISQRDEVILALCKRHLGCGTMRQRQDGVWYYEVNNFTAIVENVIPFFERFGFLSAKKKRDFSKFKQLAEMMRQGYHLTQKGIEEILKVRLAMNDGGKRRYIDAEILKQFENPQRLYAGLAEAQRDEIVRTVGQPTEPGRNDQALADPNLQEQQH
jgi:LAGLIDADG DNA endonuclease family protein